VKGIAPVRVIFFLLLGACWAWCQKTPSVDLVHGLLLDAADSPPVQREEMRRWSALPDAPSSIQAPNPAARFGTLVNRVTSPMTLGLDSVTAGAVRAAEMEFVTPGPKPSLTALDQMTNREEKSSTSLGKYLDPPLFKQDAHYYASTSSSFMGRASFAASRIFITRDDSGKGRLNTRYFLGVLTSVASSTARRPYWARSTSATLNNFGSTIGNDAGMNVFHEFGPGIRETVKGLTPKFVFRIEERINHSQIAKDAVSIPAR
jgi:hypothetical protein